ncbi:MAG: NFACT family protein [Clostridia bacterium]|nr:NFACT family protein [Clostridia bacterium]
MAFDTLCVKKMVSELLEKLSDARIDKIYQPEKDELLFAVRTKTETLHLVLSASANNARIHFTDKLKENPLTAPMFCMLLRKHLTGGRITAIIQPEYERIIEFEIETRNELGDLTKKHLIVEITGRNSNIILTNADYKIIDSIKRVDFTQSSVRQILPNLQYLLPPKQDKIPILSDKIGSIVFDFSAEGKKPENVIMDAVSGISPLTAREIVFSVLGTNSLLLSEISEENKQKLTDFVRNFAKNTDFAPCILFDGSGKPAEFSAIAIFQYGKSYDTVFYNSMSEVIDVFYRRRDELDRIRQKSSAITKLLKNNIERCAKKLSIQQKTLKDAENKEKYKIYGDLVTANIYKISKGDTAVILENYYEDGSPSVKIELMSNLSPSQNAQRYYKLYSKLKNAEIEVKRQIDTTLSDLEYFESTLALTENLTSEADINAVKSELSELGYIKRQKSAKRQKTVQAKPLHFVSSDGFDIYVGKNNTQNDYLTLKFANSADLWFHTKQIHGSHTVIKLGVEKNIPDRTVLEAAQLSAYYSKARESSQVPVDYTQIKNVKKPNGAKPGMVIYDNYNTLYVTPKSPEELGLITS